MLGVMGGISGGWGRVGNLVVPNAHNLQPGPALKNWIAWTVKELLRLDSKLRVMEPFQKFGLSKNRES